MHCTVAEMRRRIDEVEFQQWRAYRQYRLKQQVRAMKAAKAAAEEGG